MLIAIVLACAVQAQPSEPATELYRFVMIQAAPGKLMELIDLYRGRLPVIAAGGDEAPLIVRHSQGDRWDLLVIYPSGSFTTYYSADRVAKREGAAAASGVPGAAFAKRFYDLVSWHEDVYVEGPPVATLRAHVRDAKLVHLEMLQALTGKRDALINERKMENAFNRERGRPETLIFTHDQGAAWDVITLDAYRDWRHYAESDAIPQQVNDAAARKAGFPDADAIGPSMRTLISAHHDTFGTVVR